MRDWTKRNGCKTTPFIFSVFHGDEDGLFTPEVLSEINSALLGNPSPYRFQMIGGASHALYIDQQVKFLDALSYILEK
ncbi:hypothetical protein WDW86_20855 [Bdellovibrionota bacterium FG-2]